MNNSNEVPPWLREQLARFEQLQQNLQAILASKQQIDAESSEIDRATAELKKATETDAVYKSAGNILIKSKKEDLMKDLEERKELSSTRATVLGKQEQRVRESIKELSTKLEGALKGSGTPTSAPSN